MNHVSLQQLRILRFMLSVYDEPVCGVDLIKGLKMQSGTVYPLLQRMESRGLVSSKMERGTSQGVGRPLKRLYTLKAPGRNYITRVLRELA